MNTAFQNGGINAAAAVIPSIDDQPGASDADKVQLKLAATAQLQGLKSANSTAISANKTAFEEILKSGAQPPLETLQDFQNRAVSHRYAAAVSTLSPSQHDELNGVGQPLQAAPATQNTHPLAPSSPITPQDHPGEYGGAMVVNGKQFSFVTGGGGRGSSPPGDHEITGYRTDGVFAGRGGAFTVADVYDPKVGATRSAVEIHSETRGATAGCFGVPAAQWPAFKQECQDVYA